MDAGMEGRAGAPFSMVVEGGKIREFARAVRASHHSYLAARVPVAPPTFLVTEQFWRGPESNPIGENSLNVARLLHGAQEFTFHGSPPRAGDRLIGVARVDKVYEKIGRRGGNMSFVELVTEYRDARGALIAESCATLIETSGSSDGRVETAG